MQAAFNSIQPFLNKPFIRRVRRNHGLEHATIHIMSRKVPHLRIVGRSDDRGFNLFGDVSTEVVEASVDEALQRMRSGEHGLAIHPNCGTNLVTAAGLSAVAVLATLIGSERERGGKLARLPLMMIGIMGALILSQPLGARIQQNVTTLGDPADLQLLEIKRSQRGRMTIHRIKTRSS